MDKKNILWLGVGFALLMIFNILYFWLNIDRTSTSIWVTYAFIHFAYIQFLAIPFIFQNPKGNQLFFLTRFTVAATYFLTELVLGSVLILMKFELLGEVFLIQFVILLVNLFMLYINIFAYKKSVNTEVYIKSVQKTNKRAITHLQNALNSVELEDKLLIDSLINDILSSPLLVEDTIRGIENNINEICKTIFHLAKIKNFEQMRLQVALVTQLVQLRKNGSLDK